uniref:Secreted protein n=1 Tax=Caenorhabditis tropicalis TaxID=1561998 RepID=A0A1I7TYD1_9PELO
MRQIALIVLFLVVFIENVSGAVNDTLEMELESNITVVKLEHGLKFQAHSEFGLPDNMTDLFNSTAADSEGANNSSLPVDLEHSRARRSNKDGEIQTVKKATTKKVTKQKGTTKKTVKKTTKKKKVTTKKPKTTTKKPKVTTKKPKTTTKKPKVTTKKPKTTTKKPKTTTRNQMTTKWVQTPQHMIPGQRDPPNRPQTKPTYPWTESYRPSQTTTRRVFVMYEDDEVLKKKAKKRDDYDFPDFFVMRSS